MPFLVPELPVGNQTSPSPMDVGNMCEPLLVSVGWAGPWFRPLGPACPEMALLLHSALPERLKPCCGRAESSLSREVERVRPRQGQGGLWSWRTQGL